MEASSGVLSASSSESSAFPGHGSDNVPGGGEPGRSIRRLGLNFQAKDEIKTLQLREVEATSAMQWRPQVNAAVQPGLTCRQTASEDMSPVGRRGAVVSARHSLSKPVQI